VLFAFHDIKRIFEAYLDDIEAHSRNRQDHYAHLQLVFEWCRHYRIHLNPNKCTFCVEYERLLGFIVLNKGIMVDPLKVEAIVSLPPPANV